MVIVTLASHALLLWLTNADKKAIDTQLISINKGNSYVLAPLSNVI